MEFRLTTGQIDSSVEIWIDGVKQTIASNSSYTYEVTSGTPFNLTKSDFSDLSKFFHIVGTDGCVNTVRNGSRWNCATILQYGPTSCYISYTDSQTEGIPEIIDVILNDGATDITINNISYGAGQFFLPGIYSGDTITVSQSQLEHPLWIVNETDVYLDNEFQITLL